MVRDSARQMLQAIPRRMAQGGAAGSFSDEEVAKFIQDTYAQYGGPGVEAHKVIADAMAQYGVGVNQMARASGYTPREVEAEFMGQRAGEAPVLDDPTGTAAGMSAAYRAAAQAGGQQTVEDYYANLRADAAAYLANPNAPTGVDAYNQLIQSGISTSDLKNAGVADEVLNKIFTMSGPIEQPQLVTPLGLKSAYYRSPDLVFERQRLDALGQDGRAILDKQGRDYIANLQQDGIIDAAERAQMLEYATERGYTLNDLIGAGVDPNVLFTQAPPVVRPPVAPPPTMRQTVAQPSPFPDPVSYTPTTVYQPLPTQPDIFAPGQVALDEEFRASAPRTAIPEMPGQFDYTPAAKLRPATGAGMSWTPPSVTSRPRSLLSPLTIQGYGGTLSASQRFAQNRALIDRNLRDMLNATPALRNASTYNLLRNQVMSGRFGPDPNRVFDPTTSEGEQFQAYLASLAGAAPTAGAVAGIGAGSPIAAGGGVPFFSDIDPTDRQMNAAGIGSNVVGGADLGGFGDTTARPLVYGGYGNYPLELFNKGGEVTASRRMLENLSGKKSEESARDELARFDAGGIVSGRRRLNPGDDLYITEDEPVNLDQLRPRQLEQVAPPAEEQIPLDELIRRQLEGIDNTPSTARTQGSRQSESRNMLQNITAGAMQIPGTVMDYGRGIMQSEAPLAQLGSDVKGMGGALVEGAKQDPLGFTLDMLPIIGEIRSGLDAKKFSDMANEAEAAGDTALADTYRQVATLGAAGAVPFGGIGFRGARRSAMSNISDASPGSARGMLDELTPETGVVGTSNVPGVEVGQVISERFPTAVGATENPLSEILRADLLTLGRSKEQQQKIADVVSKYSNYRGGAKSPDVVINDMKEHVTDNLRFIYDQMPPEIRREASKWYEGANRKSNELAKQYGTSRESSSGVIAAMSPQKDWYQNVSLSERVMDIYHNKSDIPMDDKIYRTGLDKLKNQDQLFALDRIKDRSLNSLSDPLERAIWVRLYDETYNPRSYSIYSPSGERLSLAVNANGEPRKVAWGSFNEIAKAINVLDNPKIDNISRQMGVQHKVRNFYNNIVNPFDPLSITSDTHAVAAGLMRPLGGSATEVTHNLGGAAGSSLTGIQGTYPIFADAYRDLATERGILPRQTQSIAWEGVRGLFTPEQKRSKPLLEKIDKIMSQFNEGSMTQRQMQDAILNEAGGINLPDWAR